MSPEELSRVVERLRKQGCDDDKVEVKSCKDALSKDVWESVSAFGNTRGGVVILGLDEKTGFRLVPGFKLNKVRDQFVSGLEAGGNARPKITNMPQYELERVDFEGGQVIVIEIAEVESRFKPCYVSDKGLSNGAYKRIDDKDVKLSSTEIFELQNIMKPSPADREPVADSSTDDLDQSLVERLLAREKARGSRALKGTDDPAVHLRRLNIVTSSGALSFAGVMGLGSYPQQFFPKLVVDVTVHPGIEKSEPGGPRFLDRLICEGPIGEAIEEAVLAVSRNLRTYSYVEGVGRREELEIPRDVLREAVANAVIHREYSSHFVGQAVAIDIFPDRIEITNPGGLWGGKTLENLEDGQSRCRNDALMQLVSRIDYAGQGAPAEGQGSGVQLMIREMQSHALDKPRFYAGLDYFKVVLQRGGMELAESREWMGSVVDRPLNAIEKAVLLEARRELQVSVPFLHRQLGHDSDEIRLALRALEEDGLMREVADDTYALAGNDSELPGKRPSSREAILAALEHAVEPVSMRELAESTGRKIGTLRAQMSNLVNEGLVVPTAATTDVSRKYLLRED